MTSNDLLPEPYHSQLDDEIFRRGEIVGRLTTSMSMLTDALLMVNALETFYQKPSSKAISPNEIVELRAAIDGVRELLRQAISTPNKS
jgi:hypothetical protein